MPEAEEMRRAALVIVTGPPGAGKTTLAHALARAVPCPALLRDEIKEGLVVARGGPGGDLQRRATDAFFDALELMLGRGVTVVAEAAFQHGIWASRLEPLQALARVRLVLCEIDPNIALARRLARGAADPNRALCHPETDRSPAPYDPPRLDVPAIHVDTSDGYRPAFETIVRFARGEAGPRPDSAAGPSPAIQLNPGATRSD